MSRGALRPDLVLKNARVITLNDRQPSAEVVAIRGDRIVWVGTDRESGGLTGRPSMLVDCGGQTLVPGFIDAHCHILAYAASLLAVDCTPSAVSSISEIGQALRDRAKVTPPGRWIRGHGYDELSLLENRHPSRRDLDRAAPNQPIRLDHRSGHACVLNSMALAQVGISKESPEPAGGVIDRDWDTGEPSGLLMEMDSYLAGAIPPLDELELREAVALASRRMLAVGITCVQDATHSNSPERWDILSRLESEGVLRPRAIMMAGFDHLDEFLERGIGFGSGDQRLSLGAVKLMLTATSGALVPSAEELRRRVRLCRGAGFQVAIHAVEAEAVEAVSAALAMARPPGFPALVGGRDRIEHCSECPPASLERLAASGTVVVTQPAFLYHGGRRYLSEVAEDVRPWLYRIRSFQRAGLRPAAGSDAPVTEPKPLLGIYSAVTRRTESGETVGECERISAGSALRMHTADAARAAFKAFDRGTIQAGMLADLALLDKDPTLVESEQIRGIDVTMTLIGGTVAWRS